MIVTTSTDANSHISKQQLLITASSSYVTRYHHYGRELVLFLLQHGQSSLQLYLNIVVNTSTCIKGWLKEQYEKHRNILIVAYIARALKLLRNCWKPLQQLLCGLVSLQLHITTNDDLDSDNTKASARVNSTLALLFGMIRLRSHSCLQLSLPHKRSQHFTPEFSLVSPAVSPRCSQDYSVRQQHSLYLQQQTRHSRSPRRCSRLQPLQQGSPSNLQQSSATDSEVHVLCSSDLRSAILSFLQNHSATSGQEFVLLRSTPWASTAAAAAAESSCCAEMPSSRSSCPASSDCIASAHTVPPGASGRIRQSREMFQALAEGSSSNNISSGGNRDSNCSSPRTMQPVRGRPVNTAISHDQDDFTFSYAQSLLSPSTAPVSCMQGSSSSRSKGAVRNSWPAESSGTSHVLHSRHQSSCIDQHNAAYSLAVGDAVVAVSIDQPHDSSPRMWGCSNGTPTAATAHSSRPSTAQQHYQNQKRAHTGRFVAPTVLSAGVLEDPSLTPLMAFSSNKHAAVQATSQLIESIASSGSKSRELLNKQQIPVCTHTGMCEGAGYTPPRSASPIGVPACRVVRKSTSRKLPHVQTNVMQQH